MPKIEDAKKFQAILTPKNKEIIEKLLDIVDPCFYYSGSTVKDSLVLNIGERETNFLVSLIDVNDYNSYVQNLEDITPENLIYFNWLYTKYSNKLRGILTSNVLRKPDGWTTISDVSTRYDVDSEELFVKIAIYKINKECAIIEDTYGGMFAMACTILETLNDEDTINKFKKDIDITKEDIENMRKSLDLLKLRLFGAKTEKKETAKEKIKKT